MHVLFLIIQLYIIISYLYTYHFVSCTFLHSSLKPLEENNIIMDNKFASYIIINYILYLLAI